jgi:cobalt-zinc-cadmium efflux system outer membrane protein
VAKIGIEAARAQLGDALRSVAFAVTTAYLHLQHAEEALDLARRIADHYRETVRVSRERVKKGALAGNDLAKIELEQTKYEAAVIAAEQQRRLDVRALKELLAIAPSTQEFDATDHNLPKIGELDVNALVSEAMEQRPDLKAQVLTEKQAEKSIDLARRVAIPNPDLLFFYVHSGNTPSGDNPDVLGLGLQMEVPIFNRNQGDIGRARVRRNDAENSLERLQLAVAHDVAEAVVRAKATRRLVDRYELRETDAYGKDTNMLERADGLLKTAQAAYGLGATSLLELLEAQRSYNNTRADYLAVIADYRQALADLNSALGRTGLYPSQGTTPAKGSGD